MTDAEVQLLELLKERSFKRGTFQLASGATSNYYIDGKMSEVFSMGAFLIGRVLFERTKDLQFDAFGGLEVGAVPLAAATAIHYHMNGRSLEGFWVRGKTKTHGTRKLVEGGIKRGDRVLIMDDVITSGGSSLKAVAAVKDLDCTVVQVLALVDRLQGAAKLFRDHGIEYRSIFTIRDFESRSRRGSIDCCSLRSEDKPKSDSRRWRPQWDRRERRQILRQCHAACGHHRGETTI